MPFAGFANAAADRVAVDADVGDAACPTRCVGRSCGHCHGGRDLTLRFGTPARRILLGQQARLLALLDQRPGLGIAFGLGCFFACLFLERRVALHLDLTLGYRLRDCLRGRSAVGIATGWGRFGAVGTFD